MDFDVLVIGELNVDFILRGRDVRPEFGQREKLLSEAVATLGSSSGIFACGAARLGLRTAFVGVVGQDTFGEMLVNHLQSRGVDTQATIVDASQKTGVSVILSQSDGDRAILTYPGSIGALRADQVDRSLFRRAKHLHIGALFMLEALRPDLPAMLSEAKHAGMSISIDTNWDPTAHWDVEQVLSICDVFFPNEDELLAIARESTVASALDKLSKEIAVIAVKQGARGAIARCGDECAQCAAIPVRVVDTTGAGDSFDAGFLFGYLNGWSLEKSLRLGCACGSLSTRGVGGTSAQPTLGEAME